MREWLYRGIAVCLSAGVAIVLVEIGLRVTGLASPPGSLSVSEEDFQRLPGIFVPRDTVIERKEPRSPHRVTINSLGYRGPELPDRTPEQTRILFAGDSFTWGDLVHDDQTLPARLQQRLSQSCPGAVVANAGVGGTTIDSQLQMIQRGFAIEPDLVLLMFHGNDLTDLVPPTFWEQMATTRRQKSTLPLSLVYGTLNRTALWVVLRQAKARWLQHSAAAPTEGSAESRTELLDRLKEQYETLFTEAVSECKARDIPFVVTAFPSHKIFAGDKEYPHHLRWLATVADSAGVPYVDLLPTLSASGASVDDLYFLPWDGHARPRGYELGSQVLAEELRELDVSLPWCNHSRKLNP